MDLGFVLRDITHTLLRQVHQHAPAGLSMRHMLALRAIADHPGASHKDIAQHLQVTPGSLTPTIQRLTEAGLVVRVPDEHDRRIQRHELGPAGLTMKAAIEGHMAEFLGDALAQWPAPRIQRLEQTLAELQAGLHSASKSRAQELMQ